MDLAIKEVMKSEWPRWGKVQIRDERPHKWIFPVSSVTLAGETSRVTEIQFFVPLKNNDHL